MNDVATHHKSGAEGIRTPDLLVANETRYQLRHSPGTVAILHPFLSPNRSGTFTALSAPKTSPAQSSKWPATPLQFTLWLQAETAPGPSLSAGSQQGGTVTNSQPSIARTTQEVLESHLAMRKAGDLESDLAQNYAEDVVLLSWGEGVNHGASGVRKLASILHTYVDSDAYHHHPVLSDGNYGMLRWSAAGSDTQIRDGTDSFAVENGRIIAQTIAYTTYPAHSSDSGGVESS